MADARLGILLTADTQQAQQGLQQFNQSLAVTNQGLKTTSVIIPAFEKGLNSLPASLSKVRTGTNHASLALLDFTRIIQDAPYVILTRNISAVANNIEQLPGSFGRLFASAGGLKNGLKQLASSLVGAGGIGLAISLATAGLTLFGDKLFGAGKQAEEAAKKNKEFKESVDGIFSSSAKEAAETAGLVGILNNETETRQRKIAALKELKAIQPEIFGQLKLEGDAVAGLDAAYTSYLANFKTIIAVKIKQLQLEQLIQQQLRNQGVTLIGNEKLLADGTKKLTESLAQGSALYGQNPFAARLEKDAKAAQQLEADIKKLLEEITLLSKGVKVTIPDPKSDSKQENEIKRLAKIIQELLIVPVKLQFSDLDTDKEQLQKAKDTVQGFFNGSIFKLKLQPVISFSEPTPQEVNGPLQTFEQLFREELKGIKERTENTDFSLLNALINEKTLERFREQFRRFGQELPKIDLGLEAGEFTKQLQTQLDELAKKFEVAQFAANAASQAFGAAFDALLQGENPIQAIGNALKRLVVDLIKATIQTLIFKAISNLILPGSGAAGNAVSGLAGIFGGRRAGGGPVAFGKSYLVGENGPELFIPRASGTIVPGGNARSVEGFAQALTVTVVGRLSGSDILLSNNRQNRFNNRNA